MALLDAGAGLVAAFPSEDGLYEWHAMGAAAWLAANAEAMPGPADELWRRTAALAEGREDLLAAILRRFGITVSDEG